MPPNHRFRGHKKRSFRGQGHANICQWEGLFKRGVVYKCEVNPFYSKEVMANVTVFGHINLQGQGHSGVKVIEMLQTKFDEDPSSSS